VNVPDPESAITPKTLHNGRTDKMRFPEAVDLRVVTEIVQDIEERVNRCEILGIEEFTGKSAK
jgi:hypothetical protein